MKHSILGITKSAMKYFFDIDPVITENVVWQAAAQAQLIHNGVQDLRRNVQQQKTRIIRILRPDMAQRWNAA